MRKLAIVVASALLGGLVGAPSALAGDDEDFTLSGRFTEFDREDNGKHGWSEGDEVDFAFDLFDGRHDAGDGDGTCVITEFDRHDHDFAADCEVTFDLEDGELEMEGEVTDDDFRDGKVVLDVVGGSGDYDDADGTATFTGRHRDHRGGHAHGHSVSAMHAGGYGDRGDKGHRGDKDHRGGGHHRGHGHGGDRHFKVDIDLD